jgi:hypothetical protein
LSKESKKRLEKATKGSLSIASVPASFKDLPWIFKVRGTSGAIYEVLVEIQPSLCPDFQRHQKSKLFEVINTNTVWQKRTETFFLKMFRNALQAFIFRSIKFFSYFADIFDYKSSIMADG